VTVLDDETPNNEGDTGIGCARTVLAVNTVLIGLVAFSFAQGPYSSGEQELWYRYGSLAFFLAGSVLPAIALFLGRRSPLVLLVSLSWMFVVLLAFAGYVMASGGGV
jgi:asparagine N-glycosylation enzyme membrane subunit Stt3